jgi:hypothetical protein
MKQKTFYPQIFFIKKRNIGQRYKELLSEIWYACRACEYIFIMQPWEEPSKLGIGIDNPNPYKPETWNPNLLHKSAARFGLQCNSLKKSLPYSEPKFVSDVPLGLEISKFNYPVFPYT